ncbi:MAG TPA: class I SAM-dependent methyltransferase [Acidimicrobiia bacterium]|nr:class I SAM-dependent methyltransferase [Acidimicrobiia bacterium]
MNDPQPSAPSTTFETTWAGLADVEGWLTEGQARMLWNSAAATANPGRIVEIGSFRGRSTVVLASAAPPGVEVVAVDPHAGNDRGPQEIEGFVAEADLDSRTFVANLERAGVANRVLYVRRPSQDALDAVDAPIDVLYVDGAHRYGPARDDIARWGDRVGVGGTLLLHDAWNAVGVTLAQLRLLVFTSRWRFVRRSRSMAEYRREDLEGADRVRNAVRQLALLGVFARLALIKVALVARLRPLARLLGLPRGDAWPY